MAIKEKWKQVAWHGALLSLRWLFVPLGWLLVVVALFGPVTQIAKTAQLLVGLLIGIVFGAWPANSAHSFGELTER